jgi:hypothetical protein
MVFSSPKQKSYQNLHLFHPEQRVHANRKQKEEQEQEAKEEYTLYPSFIFSEAYHVVPPVRCIKHKTT